MQVREAARSGVAESVAKAQRVWAATPLRERAKLAGRLRRRIASGARELAEMVQTELPGALHRSLADTLAAEVMPLLEACRFLEREAERILETRRLSSTGRPVWLGGVESDVERAPWGTVLVLAAANYPLFLAGTQTIQALVAGNAVLWKPAPGTEAAAFALRALLIESGLDPELLTLLDSDVGAASEAIESGVDHVVLTGSAETGKSVLRKLAETLTPATMELSGCDAVFVLPGADLERAAEALAFGLRFNGSFTCMAPRRVFLTGMDGEACVWFETHLAAALMDHGPVSLPVRTFALLRELVGDAREQGADILLNGLRGESAANPRARVTLIARARPEMRAMQTDVFAPVLSVMRTASVDEAIAAHDVCTYGLTAAIFGPEGEARELAGRLRVGNVLINDIVVATADPRAAFGGRGRSGFGVTRGAEGLLGMTTPRTIQVQRSKSVRAYEATGEGHVELFAGLAEMLHGAGIRGRIRGLKRVMKAARGL